MDCHLPDFCRTATTPFHPPRHVPPTPRPSCALPAPAPPRRGPPLAAPPAQLSRGPPRAASCPRWRCGRSATAAVQHLRRGLGQCRRLGVDRPPRAGEAHRLGVNGGALRRPRPAVPHVHDAALAEGELFLHKRCRGRVAGLSTPHIRRGGREKCPPASADGRLLCRQSRLGVGQPRVGGGQLTCDGGGGPSEHMATRGSGGGGGPGGDGSTGGAANGGGSGRRGAARHRLGLDGHRTNSGRRRAGPQPGRAVPRRGAPPRGAAAGAWLAAARVSGVPPAPVPRVVPLPTSPPSRCPVPW